MSTANGSLLEFDPEQMAKSYHAKLVLLGEAGTGKSSLVLRFTRDEFVVDQQATIGAAFMTQTLRVGSAVVKLEIWDTAGAERYRSLAPMYYRGAAAAIIVYDITNHDSFENAKSWVVELKKYASPNIIIALTGNKSDLSHKRTVDSDEGRSYAEANKLIFNETSAKSGLNVGKVFLSIARNIPKGDGPSSQDAMTDSVGLAEEDENKSKGRCC